MKLIRLSVVFAIFAFALHTDAATLKSQKVELAQEGCPIDGKGTKCFGHGDERSQLPYLDKHHCKCHAQNPPPCPTPP